MSTIYKPRIGDIVFVRGHGFISHAIEHISHSAYSHCAMVVSQGKLIEAKGNEPVAIVPITKYTGEADIYSSDVALAKREAMIADCKAREGEHYGDKLIVEEFVREETGIQLPFHEDKHPICSVLLVDALRKERIPICQGIKFPDPGDIARDGLYKFRRSL